MEEPPGPANNSAARASSSGTRAGRSPTGSIGFNAASCATVMLKPMEAICASERHIGVPTGPGAMALTVMLSGSSSIAASLFQPMTAHLLAVWAPWPGTLCRPPIEVMEMRRPPPRWRKAGGAARNVMSIPQTFTSRTLLQWRSHSSSKLCHRTLPAFATAMSSPPKRRLASCLVRSRSPSRRTSPRIFGDVGVDRVDDLVCSIEFVSIGRAKAFDLWHRGRIGDV